MIHILRYLIDTCLKSIYEAIPWPDEVAFQMGVYCPGNDNYSRLIRRTVVR